MINPREQQAIQAYNNYLNKKGASAQSLDERVTLLHQLSPYIGSVNLDGNEFRHGVDDFLTHVPKENWPFALQVIREFFPFWMGNIKLIAALSQGEAYEKETMRWQALSGNLETLWHDLDTMVLSVEDSRCLQSYSDALTQSGLSDEMRVTRLKLGKLLLIKLNGISVKTPKLYRKAIDATLPVFEQAQTRQFFLFVVREFYYFWMSDPDAPQHISLDIG